MKNSKHMTLMTTIRNITLLTLLLLTASAAHAQQALFDKWEDTKDVTTVYISKNLLRLAPQGAAGKGFAKKAGKIDQLRILHTENAKAAAGIRADAKAFYKKHNYEIAMKVNEGSQRMTIYQRTLKGGRTEYALLAEEQDGNLSIINVEGTLSLDDLQDAMP